MSSHHPKDWWCTRCQFKVFGSKPSCSKCGSQNPNAQPVVQHVPPPPPVQQQQFAAQPAVAAVAAAPSTGFRNGDWVCPRCNNVAFGSRSVCRCGCPKPVAVVAPAAAAVAPAPVAVAAAAPAPSLTVPSGAPDWTCTTCNFLVFGSKPRCGKCGKPSPHAIVIGGGGASSAVGVGAAPACATGSSPAVSVGAAPAAVVVARPQGRLPDWNCARCNVVCFGSKPACFKCGAANPGLRIQQESIIAAQRAHSKALVDQLTLQVASAKAALTTASTGASSPGGTAAEAAATTTAAPATTTTAQLPTNAADAARTLQDLLAAVEAAQQRLAQAEQVVAAGPSTIAVTPPSYWDLGDAHVFPSDGVTIVDVSNLRVDESDSASPTYLLAVSSLIASTSQGAPRFRSVRKVSRVQNDRLWVYYCSNRALLKPAATRLQTVATMNLQHGVIDPNARSGNALRDFFSSAAMSNTRREANEVFLFHGTNATVIPIICEEGFDERVCSLGGNFGAGVYFAENASKSFQYVGTDSSGVGYCFISRVCLGQFNEMKGTTSPNLRRAPNGCDSVVGTPSASAGTPREFIVYDRRLTYPEYIIELK